MTTRKSFVEKVEHGGKPVAGGHSRDVRRKSFVEKVEHGGGPGAKSLSPILEKGQVWKVDDSEIEIVELGKHLTRYKLFPKEHPTRVPVHLESIRIVQNYLNEHGAKLVKSGSSG